MIAYLTLIASIPVATIGFLWRDKHVQERRAAQAFADDVEQFLKRRT